MNGAFTGEGSGSGSDDDEGLGVERIYAAVLDGKHEGLIKGISLCDPTVFNCCDFNYNLMLPSHYGTYIYSRTVRRKEMLPSIADLRSCRRGCVCYAVRVRMYSHVIVLSEVTSNPLLLHRNIYCVVIQFLDFNSSLH